MKTFVATKNLSKLDELRAIFAGSELDLDTYPLYIAPQEGETNYADNAAIKALALHKQLREGGVTAAVLADDSGLEVAALGGRPGVLSARYGGIDISWSRRRARLLQELASVPQRQRQAKFCCAMVLLHEGRRTAGYGEVEGTITQAERGRFGFGYDPIFLYVPDGKTFAEIDEAHKNAVSHRARAAAALIEALRARV